MRIDLRGHTTADRLARSGLDRVERAIGRRDRAPGAIEPPVVELLSMAALRSSYGTPDLVGVRTEISGALAGEVSLIIDRVDAAERLENVLGPDRTHAGRRIDVTSGLVDAFVDGVAEAIGTPLERGDTTAVEGSGVRFVEGADDGDDRAWGVVSITAPFRVGAGPLDVVLFIRPSPDSFEWLLSGSLGGAGLPLTVDQLRAYDHLTSAGTEQASEHLSALTGMQTRVEVSRSCLLPIDAVTDRIGGERHVGVVIESFGALSGHVLVLFPEPSARTVAETLVGADVEGDAVQSIHRSAIEEVGNIITSGLVDGWADVVDASIEITPPRFVEGRGGAIVGPLVDRTGRTRELAFVMDSTVVTDEVDVNCEIYALPDEHEFPRTLDRITATPRSPGRTAEDRPRETGETYGRS